MAEFHITTIEQACYYLGVLPNASEEMIKKAYRERSKQFHPDMNKSVDASQIFILIKEAYDFMLIHRKAYLDMSTPERGVRIFQSSVGARKQFERQKQAEKDRVFVKQWEEKKRKEKYEKFQEQPQFSTTNLSKEEEILNRIRAIWIAEGIRRQVEAEKRQLEIDNKRKIYRAFMQQRMNEADEIKDEYGTDKNKESDS